MNITHTNTLKHIHTHEQTRKHLKKQTMEIESIHCIQNEYNIQVNCLAVRSGVAITAHPDWIMKRFDHTHLKRNVTGMLTFEPNELIRFRWLLWCVIVVLLNVPALSRLSTLGFISIVFFPGNESGKNQQLNCSRINFGFANSTMMDSLFGVAFTLHFIELHIHISHFSFYKFIRFLPSVNISLPLFCSPSIAIFHLINTHTHTHTCKQPYHQDHHSAIHQWTHTRASAHTHIHIHTHNVHTFFESKIA